MQRGDSILAPWAQRGADILAASWERRGVPDVPEIRIRIANRGQVRGDGEFVLYGWLPSAGWAGASP